MRKGSFMKKISIDTFKHNNGTCDIIVNNVGKYEKELNKLCESLDYFFDGEELFGGFYKIDAFYLNKRDEKAP